MRYPFFTRATGSSPYTLVYLLTERWLAVAALVLLSPLYIVNAGIGLCTLQRLTDEVTVQDALGREVRFLVWRQGIAKASLILVAVVQGRLSLVGVSLHYVCIEEDVLTLTPLKSGVFSLHEIHRAIGDIEMSHGDTIRYHEKNITVNSLISISVKALICRVLYGTKTGESDLKSPSMFRLFDIKMNNWVLNEAVDWIFSVSSSVCRAGYFINVNSVNLAYDNTEFKSVLNDADCTFADGSGVRLAAKKQGIKLNDNVNGTDLLPHICKRAIKEGWSIYLLGSAPGVALETAENLMSTYRGLKIAGARHGYFSEGQNTSVIEEINISKADIVLVAMGSPHQEKWIAKNKHLLNAKVALAVGGLFDFYSGNISRAPKWMREIGMEWIYRLAMEPRAKFKRYVLGNPLFLWRVLVNG